MNLLQLTLFLCKKHYFDYIIMSLACSREIPSDLLRQLLESFLSCNLWGNQSGGQLEANHGWDVVPPKWAETLLDSQVIRVVKELISILVWIYFGLKHPFHGVSFENVYRHPRMTATLLIHVFSSLLNLTPKPYLRLSGTLWLKHITHIWPHSFKKL